MRQSACFIDGRSVSPAEAVHAAAALIAASRLPAFLVGACDVAGARAAIRLAERTGGVIDHIDSTIALRELDVMRGFGKFIVTPHEARQRADTVLLVGSGLTQMWPEMAGVLGLADVPRLGLQPAPRQIFLIGASAQEETLAELAAQPMRAPAKALPDLVAALRACVARRGVSLAAAEKDALDVIAEGLRRAQFGLVVYSPLALDTLAIEMLAGLVADLNKTTRFSTLSVGGSGNAETLMQTAGWMTGFPVRTGFGRKYPEHDPWRFDVGRLIGSDEADALVWIASEAAQLPRWASKDSLISLTVTDSDAEATKIHFTVGQHGRDHDAVAFARETQSLAWRRASDRSNVPSAAVLLNEIAALLSREGA
jgi:formylmethanofuran dehydrogenase subunit B